MARKAAAVLLKKHGISQIPIPVERVAELEGLEVRNVSTLPSRLRGLLVGDVIEIPVNDPHVVKRFSIAHELGHYRLGTRHQTDATERDTVERESDFFAAELLVPRARLVEVLKTIEVHREIAELFDVSTQVIRIAVQQLPRH